MTLEAAIEEIWGIAHECGLDPFPTHFEVVPASIMCEFGAYGLPGRFSHWTHGRAYHRMKTMYDYGLSKIYELVVNTNPCHAFLLDTNSLLQNKLIVAHVLSHSDFFKHNVYFKNTNRQMIESAGIHADRLRRYEYEHSIDEVERCLDAALSIQWHIDTSPYPLTKKEKECKKKPRVAGPYDDLLGYAPEPKCEHKMAPEPDLLQFIVDNAPELEDWQRDIISIVREEALYFLPQMKTKVVNEGWAAYWHREIMRKLDLSSDETIEFAAMHAGVLATNPMSINPYALGLAIMDETYRRYETPDDDSLPGGEGMDVLFNIRTMESDASLVRNYLTRKVVDDTDLYLYQHRLDTSVVEAVVTDRQWEVVRDYLANEFSTFGVPYIQVLDGDFGRRRELYLQHAHDGRELDISYAERTVRQIQRLWKRPVRLETMFDGVKNKLTCDNNGDTAWDGEM